MQFHLFGSACLLWLLAACGRGPAEPSTRFIPAPSAVPTVAEASPSPAPTLAVTALLPGSSDSEATALMEDLLEPGERRAAALRQIVQSADPRFIPVLIELLRAVQVGIVELEDYESIIASLEALSGEAFAADWPAWVEWYGGTDLSPPPGFTGWKGQLLARIDTGFGEFLKDEFPSTIRVEEIQWGGVLVDGIPALDRPNMIPGDKADYLDSFEPVFGVAIHGDARAYPLRIMDWHEMANDVVGGVPVSLAYCTLCGAGIAFAGRAPDGNTYTFGSSGFLFRSNKLMYDRQTRTLWNQLTGEPVLGPLASESATGEAPLRLDLLPVVLTTWEAWKNQHPDTIVLDLETGYNRPYLPGAAYGEYFASEGTMFPVWLRSDLLEDKARVYALRVDGVPKAYPIDRLVEEVVVNDQVAGTPVVLVASRGDVTVAGLSLRSGPVDYEAGAEVRAYQRGAVTFSPGPGPDQVVDPAGRLWEVTEDALVSPDGESVPRIQGHLAYWFGWFAFFPQSEVYEGP